MSEFDMNLLIEELQERNDNLNKENNELSLENQELHLILYSNPSKLPLEVFDENIIKAYIDDLIKDDLVEKVKE